MLTAVYPLTSSPPYVLAWLNHMISAQDMMDPDLLKKLVLNNFCKYGIYSLSLVTNNFEHGSSIYVWRVETFWMQVPFLLNCCSSWHQPLKSAAYLTEVGHSSTRIIYTKSMSRSWLLQVTEMQYAPLKLYKVWIEIKTPLYIMKVVLPSRGMYRNSTVFLSFNGWMNRNSETDSWELGHV